MPWSRSRAADSSFGQRTAISFSSAGPPGVVRPDAAGGRPPQLDHAWTRDAARPPSDSPGLPGSRVVPAAAHWRRRSGVGRFHRHFRTDVQVPGAAPREQHARIASLPAVLVDAGVDKLPAPEVVDTNEARTAGST